MCCALQACPPDRLPACPQPRPLSAPHCSCDLPPAPCPPRDEAYTGCLHGILEAAVEDIDGSVVNAAAAGLQPGQRLPRGGERVSLTVRRVLKTYAGLGLRL